MGWATFFGLGALIFWFHASRWVVRLGVAWMLKVGYESYTTEAKK